MDLYLVVICLQDFVLVALMLERKLATPFVGDTSLYLSPGLNLVLSWCAQLPAPPLPLFSSLQSSKGEALMYVDLLAPCMLCESWYVQLPSTIALNT